MSSAPASASWDDVLALVAQLDASGLADAEVVTAGVSVRVSRTSLDAASASGAPATPALVPTPPVAAATPAPTPAGAPAAPAIPVAEGPVVTAPMLGVLYHRPAPDQPPFVAVGDVVTPETTVAIIEVMKLMNPVTAGVGGVVAQICRTDGDLVEHGDVLFRLTSDPAAAGGAGG